MLNQVGMLAFLMVHAECAAVAHLANTVPHSVWKAGLPACGPSEARKENNDMLPHPVNAPTNASASQTANIEDDSRPLADLAPQCIPSRCGIAPGLCLTKGKT